ncbi:hypothetical protein [Mycoplasma sp. Mirounga ES2805-ORL]|uniref:hypothetical protein n=1 Tax=Mycoplasma sp. Mirounga ES2805-ORL TaxID=754514 RepID=UPI00197CB2F0|nr:hypothetical protein [Mycoplasma sp. Mirounga ES2805-ORL]QSF13569.1 hypothetical protein JXZ90_02770 [Mycoplasma sp. Mirounga ES2805-ORL]
MNKKNKDINFKKWSNNIEQVYFENSTYKFNNRYLVTLALYVAYFFVASFVPYMGYFFIGPTVLTILPVIVVVAAFHLGLIGAIAAGVSFGLWSFSAAFFYGQLKYQNFDIAVIPRIILALLVYALVKIIKMHKRPNVIKFVVLGFISTILNVVLVISSQHIHNAYIGKIRGILGVKEWIITHIPTLILEPLSSILISFSLFRIINHERKKLLVLNKISF